MNLTEDPPQRTFRLAARRWLGESAPDPLPLESEGTPTELDFRRSWARQLAAAGYAGIDWPKEYGGAGLGLAERAIWNEEWAHARCPEAFEDTCDQLGSTLLANATPEQCSRYLPPMLVGDETWCQAFSEPDAGSDLASLATRAEQGADGQWRITGQKVWTSHARWARWCYILARTSSDRHHGLTYFLLPMDQAGVEMRPLRQLSGDAQFAELFFDNAEAADVVGEVGDGWRVAMTTLSHERFTRSFRVCTQFRDDLDDLRARIGPIADPVMRQELAWIESRVAIFRWLLLRHLTDLSNGGEIGARGSLHKLLWSSTDRRLFEAGSHLLGLAATMGDSRWLRHYYWTRAESIFAGTTEVQHNIVAERLLGLPR